MASVELIRDEPVCASLQHLVDSFVLSLGYKRFCKKRNKKMFSFYAGMETDS